MLDKAQKAATSPLLDPAGERLVVIGEIVGAHGIRGEARMRPFNPDSTVLADLSDVFLVGERPPARSVRLERARPHGAVWLLVLEGTSTPEAVRALVRSGVAVRERDLPPLAAGEFYCYQLVGLDVVDDRGASIGSVAEVVPTGGSDVLVVRGAGKERLIPMAEPIISAVDLPRRRIVIHPIDGLLD